MPVCVGLALEVILDIFYRTDKTPVNSRPWLADLLQCLDEKQPDAK